MKRGIVGCGLPLCDCLKLGVPSHTVCLCVKVSLSHTSYGATSQNTRLGRRVKLEALGKVCDAEIEMATSDKL